MTTRKAFIEAHGGSCRNWRWSWSFVNHKARRVFFGAWDEHTIAEGQVILAQDWRVHNGRVQPAFAESSEHIALIRSGYEIWTFPMHRQSADNGTSVIKSFMPYLTRKRLLVDDKRCLAVDLD